MRPREGRRLKRIVVLAKSRNHSDDSSVRLDCGKFEVGNPYFSLFSPVFWALDVFEREEQSRLCDGCCNPNYEIREHRLGGLNHSWLV